MTTGESWYSIVDGEDLQQGDFVDGCPIFILEYSASLIPGNEATLSEITGEWQTYNVVVMNQSCDLQRGRLKFVLVCSHWPLEKLGEKNENFRSRKVQEEIRRGNMHGYFMLNACDLEEKKQGIYVVEFRLMYTVPYDFLTSFAATQKKRLRLLSPYKEHLSHALGKFFSRVGLPVDIPPFR